MRWIRTHDEYLVHEMALGSIFISENDAGQFAAVGCSAADAIHTVGTYEELRKLCDGRGVSLVRLGEWTHLEAAEDDMRKLTRKLRAGR
jgi:hypothetical protein